ncbi:MAG: hypothetical protein HQ564_09800 [Candidatus Saganbacteria bacterium]|nr:hypothetical protein [Candidatus Saganbacteria bacterium]
MMKTKLIAFDIDKLVEKPNIAKVVFNLRNAIRRRTYKVDAESLRIMGLPIAKVLLQHRIRKSEIIDQLIQYDNLIGFVGVRHKIGETTFYFRGQDFAPKSLKATSKNKLDAMLDFPVEKFIHNGKVFRSYDDIIYDPESNTCVHKEKEEEDSLGNREIINRASFRLIQTGTNQYGIAIGHATSFNSPRIISLCSDIQVGEIQSVEFGFHGRSKWNSKHKYKTLDIDTIEIHVKGSRSSEIAVPLFGKLIGLPDLFNTPQFLLRFVNISTTINSLGEIEEVNVQYYIKYHDDETPEISTFRWHPEIEPPDLGEET